MKPWLFAVGLLLMLAACTSSYPYLVSNDDCNCERYTYRDERGKFEIEVTARYEVTDRIASTIEIIFRNGSNESLSLRQAYIKGTSKNVQYPYNDRFQPMPFVVVPPGGMYTMTLSGSDTQASENPWLKIAGERVVLEMRGLLLGGRSLLPILITLVPRNPKISS